MRAIAMVRLLAITLMYTGVTLGASSPAVAGIDEGIAAHKRGDYETALREWLPLGEAGDERAQFFLGGLFFKGAGVVSKDYAAAALWWRKAAEQGVALAQLNLAFLYIGGKGVPQNNAETVKWLRLAAKQGNADAQFNLGRMYAEGKGVPVNLVAAHLWFNVASANGRKEAASYRDAIGKHLTKPQIEGSQALARACMASDYAVCS